MECFDEIEPKQGLGELINFALQIAKFQRKHKRHFLLENPGTSEAWSLDELIRFLEQTNSHTAIFDQCRFRT